MSEKIRKKKQGMMDIVRCRSIGLQIEEIVCWVKPTVGEWMSKREQVVWNGYKWRIESVEAYEKEYKVTMYRWYKDGKEE